MSGPAPTIGVLALQGDVREHLRVLGGLGVHPVPVRRAEELDGVHGLIVPGGESTTMSRLLDVFQLRGPLAERLRDGLPCYGSCAGMIMLATRILDGRPDQVPLGALDITVRRNAFGRQVDSFETELAVTGIAGGPMRAVFIRAPWVESVGPDVQVLASVADPADAGGVDSVDGAPGSGGDVGAPGAGGADGAARLGARRPVAVRQGTAIATSFHPEITDDHRMHELFVSIVREA